MSELSLPSLSEYHEVSCSDNNAMPPHEETALDTNFTLSGLFQEITHPSAITLIADAAAEAEAKVKADAKAEAKAEVAMDTTKYTCCLGCSIAVDSRRKFRCERAKTGKVCLICSKHGIGHLCFLVTIPKQSRASGEKAVAKIVRFVENQVIPSSVKTEVDEFLSYCQQSFYKMDDYHFQGTLKTYIDLEASKRSKKYAALTSTGTKKIKMDLSPPVPPAPTAPTPKHHWSPAEKLLIQQVVESIKMVDIQEQSRKFFELSSISSGSWSLSVPLLRPTVFRTSIDEFSSIIVGKGTATTVVSPLTRLTRCATAMLRGDKDALILAEEYLFYSEDHWDQLGVLRLLRETQLYKDHGQGYFEIECRWIQKMFGDYADRLGL